MILKACTFAIATLVGTSGIALAGADDIQWIGKCMVDNKDEGKGPDVVYKYCKCMNEKMDEEETQSVTQWEKSHPTEEKQCELAAGWN